MARSAQYDPPHILNPYRDLQGSADDSSDATAVLLALLFLVSAATFFVFM